MDSRFKKQIVFASLCALPFFANAQDTCTFLFAVPGQAIFATADHLANTYLATPGHSIEKYDSTGRLAVRYSNNRLGAATLVDASNPLKIVVWYADFQTAIFLDRSLTELGRLNLANAGYPAVRCIASAADGNLWAYDEASSQLLKLSTTGERLLESQPLNLSFSRPFAPNCIRDDGAQAVFVGSPAEGVAVFDAFAQLDKVLPFKELQQFEVANGRLFFIENMELRAEDWRGFYSKKIPLPVTMRTEGAKYWLSKRMIFVQTESAVEAYRY